MSDEVIGWWSFFDYYKGVSILQKWGDERNERGSLKDGRGGGGGGRHPLHTTSLYKEFNNFVDMNFFTWLKNEI